MAPELPTLNETGLAGYDASGWFGILAPASTPPAIAQRLNAEITAVLRSQEVREKFANAWLEPLPSSQEEMAFLIKTETVKWSKVIKDSGATVD
jgi:tripartite-type tricarboxylate transporter receptor subunit TctC